MIVAKSSLYVFIVLSVFAITQIFIDNSYENIISVLITFFCSLLSFLYIEKSWKKGYFLSTIPIIGCLVGTQLGPLVFQTLSLAPVIFNLRLTYITFFYTGFMLLSLLVGHYLYLNSNGCRLLRNTLHKGFYRFDLFSNVPTGFITILTFLAFISIYIGATNSIETGDTGGKFFSTFSIFTMLPLFYFVQGIQNEKISNKKYYIIIGFYFLALIALGIVRNSRGMFANFALCFFLIFIYFVYTKRVVLTKKIVMLIAILLIPLIYFFKILSILSNAMLAVRGDREDIKGLDLLKLTLNNNASSNMHQNISQFYTLRPDINGYNEIYLENDFLGRLVSIKYSDNVFYYSQFFDHNQYFKLNSFFVNKIIAIVPQPIINIFLDGFNKDDYIYSYGDWIHNLAEGAPLGGFKLGSIIGSGLNLFGFSFYLIVLLFSPLFYSFVDSLVIRYRTSDLNSGYRSNLSVLSVLILFTLFLIPNSDSLMSIIEFFLRGFLQLFITYILLFFIYKLFLLSFKNRY